VSLQSKSANTLCYLLAIFQDGDYMNRLVRFADTGMGANIGNESEKGKKGPLALSSERRAA